MIRFDFRERARARTMILLIPSEFPTSSSASCFSCETCPGGDLWRRDDLIVLTTSFLPYSTTRAAA